MIIHAVEVIEVMVIPGDNAYKSQWKTFRRRAHIIRSTNMWTVRAA